MKFRHRVRIRRSHVRYRFVHTAAATGRWTARLAVLALGFWAADAGQRFWLQSPQFKVRAVSIAQDAPAELAGKLGVGPGDHLFKFSTGRLERRLKRDFPELSHVSVRRTLDRRVSVQASWRVPEARLPNGDGWLGLDAGGAAFPLRPNVTPPEALTILAGVSPGKAALPALGFLRSLRDAGAPWSAGLAKVQLIAGGDAVIHLTDGPPIFWGALAGRQDLVKRKAERLDRVLKDELLKNGAAYVRFVTDDRVAVKVLEPAKKPVSSVKKAGPGGA